MNESLWLDEATTSNVAGYSWIQMFTQFFQGDFHPPVYYIFMKLWVGIFGNSEISLRTPSLIFGLLTVWVIYKKFGKIAAILLATGPLFFYYAQEARMYSLVTFLVAYLFVSYLDKKWLRFSITLAVLGLTDYVALFVLPVFWFLERKNLRNLIISHVTLFIGYIFWGPIFFKQITSGLGVSESWSILLGQTSFKNIALIPIKFVIGRISFDNKYIYAFAVGFAFSIFGFLLVRSVRSIKKSSIIWYWLLTPIVIGILVSFKISVLSYFRFLFCLPALYILVANGIGKSRLYFALVLCVNLLATSYYILTPRFHREDWRSLANTIGQEKIIFPVNSQKEALKYYGKEQNIVDIKNFEGKENKIFLSRYVWNVFDSNDFARKKIESLGYNKVSELNFNGIEVWKYVK